MILINRRAVACGARATYISAMTAQTSPSIHTFHPDLTEAKIARLVATFYGRARADDLIGPIFNAQVEDWDHHIAKIADFWSAVMLKTGRYDGRPMPPHLRLQLKGEHFDRWLALFETTAREIFEGDVAEAFILRARRIADSFEMGIAAVNGKITRPRHSV